MSLQSIIFEKEISLAAYKFVQDSLPETRLAYYQTLFQEERKIALNTYDTNQVREEYISLRNRSEGTYSVQAQYHITPYSYTKYTMLPEKE